MPLLTTTIGAYPKPDGLDLPDWFRIGGPSGGDPTAAYTAYLKAAPPDLEAALDRATREAVQDQVEAGIDVPSEGEIRRDNYIHYHCRHLQGFDFETLVEKEMRTGAWTAKVPAVTGPIAPGAPFLVEDWRRAQTASERPVKITLPGPLTVADTVADRHYGDERRLGAAVAEALNVEVRALAAAGCRWIQIDEPLFARYPEKALAFGIENLERAFQGAPDGVRRVVHMCCGYPDKLDETDYLKADRGAYFALAEPLDDSGVDAVSIEDAHRHNDLALLERFRGTTVILGAVAIAQTRVETREEIEARLSDALGHIEAERLMVAPDCGLGMLDRATVGAKLRNMTSAAAALA